MSIGAAETAAPGARLPPPFHYRVSWQPRNWRPGDHPAAVSGEGGAFRGERLLAAAAEARSLSIRASLRDPLRRLWVREHQQRATLDVFVVADVSRSMRIGGQGRYCHAVADLMASAALSAYRGGDRIGAICASARIDPRLVIMPARGVQRIMALARQVRAIADPNARQESGVDSVDGMLDVWRRLSARRSLVLLVSDFLAPVEHWRRVLETLRHHQVVPVVLEDPQAAPELPRWGLVHLDDAESGRSRTLLMRPSLQQRLTTAGERRKHELASMFESLGLKPFPLQPPFDAARLTEYFHGGSQGSRPRQ